MFSFGHCPNEGEAPARIKKYNIYIYIWRPKKMYSNFRNYAPPLDEKGGIITEKVVPVFSEGFFGACFGMVM